MIIENGFCISWATRNEVNGRERGSAGWTNCECVELVELYNSQASMIKLSNIGLNALY